MVRLQNCKFEEDTNADNPHEAGILELDIQKAERQLGWIPKMDSREAISQTIQWYKEYESDPLGCMNRQIVNYYES